MSASELLAELHAHWPPPAETARADYTEEALSATAPVAVLDLGSTGARRHAVAVAAGPDGLRTVPLTAPTGGPWRRAAAGDGAASALVHRVSTAPGPSGGFTLHPGRPTGLAGAESGERAVATDQTNESVIVAERSVVKWVRRPSSGDQPAMRLLELRAAGGAARRVRRQLAARRVD